MAAPKSASKAKSTKSAPGKQTQFPPEFENIYTPIKVLSNQASAEAIPEGVKDRRISCDAEEEDKTYKYTIGMLRIEIDTGSGSSIANGTAGVFAVDRKTRRVFAITAAHCLVIYEKGQRIIPKNIWFDRRGTNGYKNVWNVFGYKIRPKSEYTTSYFESKKKYNVDFKWVHPMYDGTDKNEQYDIGVVSFIDDDGYFFNIFCGDAWSNASVQVKKEHVEQSCIGIMGFPGEKEKAGELWGDSQLLNQNIKEKDKFNMKAWGLKETKNGMWEYSVHTTAGQSGSPIYANFGIYQVGIIGVHTQGGVVKNYGVKMTSNHVKWIEDCIRSMLPGTNTKDISRIEGLDLVPQSSIEMKKMKKQAVDHQRQAQIDRCLTQ